MLVDLHHLLGEGTGVGGSILGVQSECTVPHSSALVENMRFRSKGKTLGPWYLGPENKFPYILPPSVCDTAVDFRPEETSSRCTILCVSADTRAAAVEALGD